MVCQSKRTVQQLIQNTILSKFHSVPLSSLQHFDEIRYTILNVK